MQRDHQILLAEPDRAAQGRVQGLLAAMPGLALTVVPDGHAALVAAMTQRFDLMILDQNVPQISGDRVVRHLRASTCANTHTPVIRLCTELPAAQATMAAGLPGSDAAGPDTPGMDMVLLRRPLSEAALVAAVTRLLAA